MMANIPAAIGSTFQTQDGGGEEPHNLLLKTLSRIFKYYFCLYTTG